MARSLDRVSDLRPTELQQARDLRDIAPSELRTFFLTIILTWSYLGIDYN
jgi:hypothetical protein